MGLSNKAWGKMIPRWILSIAGILILTFPLAESACTPEAKRLGDGCKNTMEAQSSITGAQFSTPEQKTRFCSDDLEDCIKKVETASKEKCPGINASDETYHGIVNALRGLCRDISVYQQYSSCIDNQRQGQIRECDITAYRNRSDFERTQYDQGKYATEFKRKNAQCRLTRYAQMCYEAVIQRNCQDYIDYFRDYKIALLQPYCRQLLELTSRYVTDDPNIASSLFVHSRKQIIAVSIAVLAIIHMLT